MFKNIYFATIEPINPVDRRDKNDIYLPCIEGVRVLFWSENEKKISSIFKGFSRGRKKRYKRLFLRIEKEYASNLTLESVLEEIPIGRNRFYKDFRKLTGTTFADYLLLLRAYMAGYLLLNSTIPVEKVGYDCGFSTQSNFRKVIKDVYGMSPSEMRDDELPR